MIFFCFPYLCLHLDVESTDVKSEPASPEEDATRTHFGNGLKLFSYGYDDEVEEIFTVHVHDFVPIILFCRKKKASKERKVSVLSFIHTSCLVKHGFKLSSHQIMCNDDFLLLN